MFDDLINAADPEASLWGRKKSGTSGFDPIPVDLIGLVAADSGGGTPGKRGVFVRSHRFAAWRVDGQAVECQPLVAFERTEEQFDSAERTDSPATEPYVIAKTSVRLDRGSHRAVISAPSS